MRGAAALLLITLTFVTGTVVLAASGTVMPRFFAPLGDTVSAPASMIIPSLAVAFILKPWSRQASNIEQASSRRLGFYDAVLASTLILGAASFLVAVALVGNVPHLLESARNWLFFGGVGFLLVLIVPRIAGPAVFAYGILTGFLGIRNSNFIAWVALWEASSFISWIIAVGVLSLSMVCLGLGMHGRGQFTVNRILRVRSRSNT